MCPTISCLTTQASNNIRNKPKNFSVPLMLASRPRWRACADTTHASTILLSTGHVRKLICSFVRADSVAAVKQRLVVYKTFRKLIDQWVEMCIQQGELKFFNRPAAAKAKPAPAKPTRRSGKKTHLP